MTTSLTKKYNGWANRSTWLAKVHLDNTTADITRRAHEIGVASNTLDDFKADIYPLLRRETQVDKEQDFLMLEVEWDELWDAYRFTK